VSMSDYIWVAVAAMAAAFTAVAGACVGVAWLMWKEYRDE